MKTIKPITVVDCINNESVITSEATTFPDNGAYKDVICLSIDDQSRNNGILLSPDDAELFANSILQQVKYSRRKVSVIETDDDSYLSVQTVIPTLNEVPQSPEVAIVMANGNRIREVVSILSFEQANELIYQLHRLLGR